MQLMLLRISLSHLVNLCLLMKYTNCTTRSTVGPSCDSQKASKLGEVL